MTWYTFLYQIHPIEGGIIMTAINGAAPIVAQAVTNKVEASAKDNSSKAKPEATPIVADTATPVSNAAERASVGL